MKKLIAFLLSALFIGAATNKLFSQSNTDMQEFGITAGGFTNFPANQDYLKKNMSALYVAPYLRTGKHEFSLGMVFPLKTDAIYFTDESIGPRPGAIAGYKFYVFNVFGRENMFVHYSFQYLRFKGDYQISYEGGQQNWKETDMYINNVIGFGYNLFFDMDERFGLYYVLDYVISQSGYKRGGEINDHAWTTVYVWNNISTHIGFSFKLTSLKKKGSR